MGFGGFGLIWLGLVGVWLLDLGRFCWVRLGLATLDYDWMGLDGFGC